MKAILFLAIFIITLAVPFYNRTGPSLFGFPFFYWYQMTMVLVSSGLLFIVFKSEDRAGEGE